MVNVCGDDKIVLVPHQLQKVIVDQFGGIHIAVDVDVSAPIRPMLFRRGKRIKATGVHIVEAVFFLEVRKVFLKAFAAVGEACGGRQPCPAPTTTASQSRNAAFSRSIGSELLFVDGFVQILENIEDHLLDTGLLFEKFFDRPDCNLCRQIVGK